MINLMNTVQFGPVVYSALTSPSSGWSNAYIQNVVFEALGSQSAFITSNLGSCRGLWWLEYDQCSGGGL